MKNVTKVFCLKRPSLLIILIIYLILLVGIAGASSNETVSIDSLRMDTDTTSNVQIYIGNAVDITGMSLDINYDPLLVEVIKVSGNDKVAGSSVNAQINNDAGKVSIALVNTETINSADPLPVINIVLHSKSGDGGTTELILDNVEVTDTTFVPRSPKSVTNGNLVLDRVGYKEPISDVTGTESSENNVAGMNNSHNSQNDDSGTNQETNSTSSGTNNQNIQTEKTPTPEVPGFEAIWTGFILFIVINLYGKNRRGIK